MKCIIFCHSLNQHGGASKVTSQMASHWADTEKYDITVLNQFGPNKSIYEISPKVKIVSTLPDIRENINKYVRNLLSPLIFPSLLKIIKTEKPDLLILNNSPYYSLVMGIMAAKITKTPCVVWKHAGHFMHSSPMYKLARKVCFPKADALVLLTKGDCEHAKKLNPNSFIIRNPSLYSSDISINSKPKKIALFVGRLAKQKCLDHLLKAWAKADLKGWVLQIVGDGEERVMLETLTKNLKITDSVEFTGDSRNVEQYYKNASFFILSSMSEGLPMVLIEALAYNLPLISYDCPYGPAEVIDNGKNGILVKNGDINGLANAINEMASSEEMRKSHAEHAKIKRNEFSFENISKQWDSLIDYVMNNNSTQNKSTNPSKAAH